MWTCLNCGRQFQRSNQNHFCSRKPKTIDEYIAMQKEELQPLLQQLRDDIRCAAPEAIECIAWSMPSWKHHHFILHMAANKENLGFTVGEDAISFFSRELEGYPTKKGTIYFPYDAPLPHLLIKQIASWCYDNDTK